VTDIEQLYRDESAHWRKLWQGVYARHEFLKRVAGGVRFDRDGYWCGASGPFTTPDEAVEAEYERTRREHTGD